MDRIRPVVCLAAAETASLLFYLDAMKERARDFFLTR
jgi:hypothetical protein